MSRSRSWATGEKGVPVPLDEIVDPGSHLERVVTLAQRHLDVDAVCIAERRPDGVHYCRAAAGDAAAFDVVVGAPLPPSLAGLTDATVSGTAPVVARKAASKGRGRTQVA